MSSPGRSEEAERTLFVGNLESRVREEILYELFLQVEGGPPGAGRGRGAEPSGGASRAAAAGLFPGPGPGEARARSRAAARCAGAPLRGSGRGSLRRGTEAL